MTLGPIILGVDLSGPANHTDTACSVFECRGDHLVYQQHQAKLSDAGLTDLFGSVDRGSSLTVGLDAPLSYQDGGGDRPRDRELRRALVRVGMPSGTIMTPTMTRMAYLTLRGVSLSRMLLTTHPKTVVVEVHPFGALALGGATVEDVTLVKKDRGARHRVAMWLSSNGVEGLPEHDLSDHELASFGAAWAVWRWRSGRAAWVAPAEPPQHPHAFIC